LVFAIDHFPFAIRSVTAVSRAGMIAVRDPVTLVRP
jgi:hypothetical protein